MFEKLLGNQPKNRSFEYRPLYYNVEEEQLNANKKAREETGKATIQFDHSRRWQADKSRLNALRKSNRWLSMMAILLILGVLLLLVLLLG